MKLFHLLISVLLLAFLAGCTTTPTAPTSGEVFWAQVADDGLSLGLVPVLTKNVSYLAAAQSVAVALGTFSGATLTPADVDAFLAKTPLTAADAKQVAGMVNAAWGIYVRHYQQTYGSTVRPDVKLFLSAVADGINNAVAAVPKS